MTPKRRAINLSWFFIVSRHINFATANIVWKIIFIGDKEPRFQQGRLWGSPIFTGLDSENAPSICFN